MVFSSTAGNDIRYYVGASYFHFNEPKVAFNVSRDVRLNKKIMVNVGISVPTSDYDRLILYADYFA
ncbi:MAG: hypothetical protein EOO03_02005 [Chitinophagaceae bacterium]|nr:MAG: hypothetical protein EOO03_02005 [Chitinophagaceae bacterium]